MHNSVQDTWCDIAADRTADQRAVKTGIRPKTVPLSHLGTTATTIGWHRSKHLKNKNKIIQPCCLETILPSLQSTNNHKISAPLPSNNYRDIEKRQGSSLSQFKKSSHYTLTCTECVPATQPIMKEL